MLKQDLISPARDSFWDFMLTDKGKKTAIALKEEALRYIEDFSFLLDRKTSSTPKGTALSPT